MITGLDPWIRYFRSGPRGSIDAFRFQLFASNQPDFVGSQSGAQILTNFLTAGGVPLNLSPTEGSGFAYAWDPALQSAYQVLSGPWLFSPASSPSGATAPVPILLGQSGSEFASTPRDWLVQFVPGGPAFIGPTGSDFPLIASSGITGPPVTTSWLYVVSPGKSPAGGGYYTQPQQGPLFTPIGASALMQPLPLMAAGFPQGVTAGVFGAPSPAFPMAPYAGIQIPNEAPAGWYAAVEQLEATVLNPARSQAIYALNAGPIGCSGNFFGGADTGPTAPSGPAVAIDAVTPQGLLSQFSAGGTDWLTLTLATSIGQTLQLTDIRCELREAMLSNQLFLVVSDPQELLERCSTPYAITDQVLLAAAQPPYNVPADALQAAANLTAVYPSATEMRTALAYVLGSEYAQYVPTLLDLAPLAQLSISGWTFDLAPQNWLPDAGGSTLSQTVMIVNFSNQPLQALIDDLSWWTLGGTFNEDPATTQSKLQNFIASTLADAATEPDLQYFVQTVLGGGGASPSVWNGILFLNVPVPPNAFPPQLAPLAAGFSSSPLTAHHFGVNLAPFSTDGSSITVQDSSLFAVILYDNPAFLLYQNNPYAFQVNSLHVLFVNSVIVAFSSQVELLVAELFGERSMLENSTQGDNIILNGVFQQQGGNDSYTFTFNGINHFAITSRVLESVVITNAQLVTIVPPGGLQQGQIATTRFLLAGTMQFQALENLDLFSFTSLPFSNMYVSMTVDPSSGSATFAFVAAQMQFGTGAVARSGSLYAQFPLKATAMLQSGYSATGAAVDYATPDALGFMDVLTPVPEPGLGDLWFGVQMSLDLGTPGALAPTLPFSGSFLAAWSPDANAPNIFAGLQLPGFNGQTNSLPIEGPLKLSLGNITLVFNEAQAAYLMTFESVALDFLGFEFPYEPINAMIFGNPDPGSTTRSLAWYAAYADAEEEIPAGATGGTPAMVRIRPPSGKSHEKPPEDCIPCRK